MFSVKINTFEYTWLKATLIVMRLWFTLCATFLVSTLVKVMMRLLEFGEWSALETLKSCQSFACEKLYRGTLVFWRTAIFLLGYENCFLSQTVVVLTLPRKQPTLVLCHYCDAGSIFDSTS